MFIAIVKVQNHQKVWTCFTLKQVKHLKMHSPWLDKKKTCPAQSPSFLLQFKRSHWTLLEPPPPSYAPKHPKFPPQFDNPHCTRNIVCFLGWFLKKVQEARFSTMERKGRNISATALSPPLAGRYWIRWGVHVRTSDSERGKIHKMLKQHPVPGVFSSDVQKRHVEAQQRFLDGSDVRVALQIEVEVTMIDFSTFFQHAAIYSSSLERAILLA